MGRLRLTSKVAMKTNCKLTENIWNSVHKYMLLMHVFLLHKCNCRCKSVVSRSFTALSYTLHYITMPPDVCKNWLVLVCFTCFGLGCLDGIWTAELWKHILLVTRVHPSLARCQISQDLRRRFPLQMPLARSILPCM